jgi:hypothetical protein
MAKFVNFYKWLDISRDASYESIEGACNARELAIARKVPQTEAEHAEKKKELEMLTRVRKTFDSGNHTNRPFYNRQLDVVENNWDKLKEVSQYSWKILLVKGADDMWDHIAPKLDELISE